MKVYFTLVMRARKPPHTLNRAYPDHYWAMRSLMTIGTPAMAPAVSDGLWPHWEGFPGSHPWLRGGPGWISRERRRGYGYLITVVPPPLESLAKPYITLPIQLWSRGWLNVMSARALFAYTCLRLVVAGEPDSQGAHVSSWDRERFAIKDDTWQRGTKELEALGLVRTDMAQVVVDRWLTDLRERKAYYLNNKHLINNDSPLVPVN